jgi:hypothetical protein
MLLKFDGTDGRVYLELRVEAGIVRTRHVAEKL